MLCVMSSSAVSSPLALRISSSTCAWTVASSAVVGSSAMMSRGFVISTEAIMTRCCWPPERRNGYSPRHRAGSSMPALASPSAARASASRRVIGRWRRMASTSWSPILWSGESAVMGSWKTMPTADPRIRRSASSGSVAMSCPSKAIAPEAMRPGGFGTSRKTLMAVTDLPQPDSPTSPSVSPASRCNDTPSTACTTPSGVSKTTCRSRMSRMGFMIISNTVGGRGRRGGLRR